MNLKIMLDNRRFTIKPTSVETAGVQNRFKVVEIELRELADLVGTKGQSMRPAVLEGGKQNDNFVEQQIFLLDFDNGLAAPFEMVKNRAESCGLQITFAYSTFSSTEALPKYRVAFVSEKPVADKKERDGIIKHLLEVFPEADQRCSDAARPFFGGKEKLLYYDEDERTFDPESIPKSVSTEEESDRFARLNRSRSEEMKALLKATDLVKLIREQNPDIEVIDRGKYVEVNPCPICGHQDDFKVYKNLETDGISTCHCFGANGRDVGDALNYVMITENLPFTEALDKLRRLTGADFSTSTKEDFESGMVFEKLSSIEDPRERVRMEILARKRAKEVGFAARDLNRMLAAYGGDIVDSDGSEYVYRNGQLIHNAYDKIKSLANYDPRPKAVISVDDGQTIRRDLIIDIVMETGTVQDIRIPVESLGNPAVFQARLPLTARTNPAQGSMGYVVDCIRSRCERIEQRSIYSHTGMRKVDGQWVYLHGGGALGGADNITTELPPNLSNYRFEKRDDVSEVEAVEAVLKLFDVAPPDISYPMLGFTYLTPLTHFLESEGITPSTLLYLRGMTGSFKTSLALVYLAHFREYTGPSSAAPTNFHSTANAIEKMAFTLKDSLLLVDDLHPASPREKASMEAVMQRMARAGGDHISRGRLKSNLEEATSYTPRGLIMISGEDLPTGIEESGIARLVVLNFENGLISGDALAKSQSEADLLNVAMQNYIRYLISKANELEFRNRFTHFRKKAAGSKAHLRQASNVAWIMIGLESFTEYAISVGAMTDEEAEAFCQKGFETMMQISEIQTQESMTEKPAVRFLTALDELLSSRQRTLINLEEKFPDYWSDRCLGYDDRDFIYLLPGASLTAVSEVLRKNNQIMGVGKQRLFGDLASQGYILSEGGRNTVNRRLGSSQPQRYLIIKKAEMEKLRE